jgi:hypothetical protein
MGITPRSTVHAVERISLPEHQLTGTETYELDPIAVADGAHWTARIGEQPNLPRYIKDAPQNA